MAVYATKWTYTSLSASITNRSPSDLIRLKDPWLSKLLRTAVSRLEGSSNQSLKEAIDKTMPEVSKLASF